MTLHLGFAIAAHLEPEILVVDKVLVVGDAEFQKKANSKMQDISKGEGRTELFVSHNMDSIRKLCTNGILLENGIIKVSGEVNKICDEYLFQKSNDKQTCEVYFKEDNSNFKTLSIKLLNSKNIVSY